MGRYDGLTGIPRRGELLEELNLFCRIEPLKRPRNNYHTPRDNQLSLYNQINYYIPNGRYKTIDKPVIIDIFTFYSIPKARDKEFPTAQGYGDHDNLVKAVNDALAPHSKIIGKLVAGKILQDDRLIVGGENFKLFDQYDEDGNSENYCVVKIYKPIL